MHPSLVRSGIFAAVVFIAFGLTTPISAQTILVTNHKGKVRPVVAAKGAAPYIELDGKLVRAEGNKFGFMKVKEFLPVFVAIRQVRVNTSSISLIESGQQLNHEFHINANFQSPHQLEDVFLVLELIHDQTQKSLFLHEIGRLEANKSRPLNLTVRTSFGLGEGKYRLHLYSGGIEVLHSQMPFAAREAMLDGMIARRSKDLPDGPPSLLFGPMPVNPYKRGKSESTGKVMVRARVRATGAVLDPTVAEASDPKLGEAALDAIRQWRFLPCIKNGRPVDSIVNLPVTFGPANDDESEPSPE